MIYYTIRYNDFYSIETPCNTLKRVNKQLFLSSTTTETARVIAAVTGVQGIMDRFDYNGRPTGLQEKRKKHREHTGTAHNIEVAGQRAVYADSPW